MPYRIFDRFKATSTTTGTGTLAVGAASTGFQGLTAWTDGDSGTFVCADQGGANWEVFDGTVGGSGTTLTRDAVRASSNSGALVNFGAGSKDVFGDVPAAMFTRFMASTHFTACV